MKENYILTITDAISSICYEVSRDPNAVIDVSFDYRDGGVSVVIRGLHKAHWGQVVPMLAIINPLIEGGWLEFSINNANLISIRFADESPL